MLIYFNDAKLNKAVAINPHKVVAVFVLVEDETEYTVINTDTGNILVDGTQLEVVSQINGAM